MNAEIVFTTKNGNFSSNSPNALKRIFCFRFRQNISLKRFLVIVSMDALQRFFVVNNLKYVMPFPCALFRDYQDNYFNS